MCVCLRVHVCVFLRDVFLLSCDIEPKLSAYVKHHTRTIRGVGRVLDCEGDLIEA